MITKALLRLRPGSAWSLDGTDKIIWEDVIGADGNPTGETKPVNLIWLDTVQTCPTKKEIEDEVAKLEAEWAATEYQRLRQPAYPELAEFADAYYWAQQGDNTKMEAYLAKVAAVKEQFPKE